MVIEEIKIELIDNKIELIDNDTNNDELTLNDNNDTNILTKEIDISHINLNILTDKINNLYNDGFKTIYEILKNNEENIIHTKKYYLINLDNIKNETLVALDNYINYLEDSFNKLDDEEKEREKLRNEIN